MEGVKNEGGYLTRSGDRPVTHHADVAPVNCIAEFAKTTSVNLSRAVEIVQTLISRIEGEPPAKSEKCSMPSPICLMNVAADSANASRVLTEHLDYLAKLITGSC